MEILTNGTSIDKAGTPRMFEQIAEHGPFVWVKAVNGNYAGELLTFLKSALQPVASTR